MPGTLFLAGWLLALAQGGPSVVRVDSREQGRTFYVDTDRPKIREGLRDASAPSPAGDIPSWLRPYPGAAPWGERARENAPVDFGFAGYTTTAPPDDVFAYYESSVRATPGVTITYVNRQPGRGGAMHAEDATRKTVVAVSPGPKGTSLSFNWQPKVIHPVPLAKSAHLVGVWFDDSKGILRLRDPATGKEYDLSMTTMLSYARSVPLEPSARTDFPVWLAFYPGAKVIVANAPPAGWQPQGPADMRTFKIEQMSTASVAQVGAFYKQTFEQNGLTIASETAAGERYYALEARTTDRMHVVYLEAHGQPNGTKIVMMDHYSWPRP